jgi:dihydropteroate synthase
VRSFAVRRWKVGSREIVLDRPIVMGILNVTPEGNAVGGNSFSVEAVVERAARMVDEGADILDIGGESTLPGAAAAPADAELKRVLPSVRAVRERWPDLPLSIDTAKSGIARSALEVGADIINDVSAMRLDPVMPIVAGSSGCGLILTHSRGGISDMSTYAHANYHNVTADVIAELSRPITKSIISWRGKRPPRRRAIVVRFDGRCRSDAATGPSPRPAVPWQAAQWKA